LMLSIGLFQDKLFEIITPKYTVRQKLSTTWLVSIISFLIMNLFQISLLFSLPVHTYLLTCETGYWSIFIYVYMTRCATCTFQHCVCERKLSFKFHFLLVW
jgi:hypothetical protein